MLSTHPFCATESRSHCQEDHLRTKDLQRKESIYQCTLKITALTVQSLGMVSAARGKVVSLNHPQP